MMHKQDTQTIKAVVLDWTGTTVDYGGFAPTIALMDAFRRRGISITLSEARQPIETSRSDAIREILKRERVRRLWIWRYKTPPTERDVQALYSDLESRLFEIIARHADIIPGTIELVAELRRRGVKIGSTTGYPFEMMAILSEKTRRYGYAPDCIVTPDNLPSGRPSPWMMYQNAISLGVNPLHRMVKVGDTLSDIREGVHADAWSVGVVKGGAELGLSRHEVETMPTTLLRERIIGVRKRFFDAGAHYVIDTIGDLMPVVEEINQRLGSGELPAYRDHQVCIARAVA